MEARQTEIVALSWGPDVLYKIRSDTARTAKAFAMKVMDLFGAGVHGELSALERGVKFPHPQRIFGCCALDSGARRPPRGAGAVQQRSLQFKPFEPKSQALPKNVKAFTDMMSIRFGADLEIGYVLETAR